MKPGLKSTVICRAVSLAIVSAISANAHAADPDQVDLGTIGSGDLQTVEVYAQRYSAAAVAPTQSNLDVIEPQSIISRAFIDAAVPPSGNFSDIVAIAPSVSAAPSPSGPGVQDSNTGVLLRGFNSDQYTLRFDGIPFGDTNDPSNHPSAYFPASMLGGVIVDRGPGTASDMGQSDFGGSINLFSRTPSDTQQTTVFSSYGSWDTWLAGGTLDTGRMKNDGTLTITYQHLSSQGYLSHEGIDQDAGSAKYQIHLGGSTVVTAFITVQDTNTPLPDSSGAPTYCQVFGGTQCTGPGDVGKGMSYGLSGNPQSQNYYGYNYVDKKTDFEYVRLQSELGAGWSVDNRVYSYAYQNKTISGLDGTEQTPNTTDYGVNLPPDFERTSVPLGDVPGYNKLNAYRVAGDIVRFVDKVGPGELHVGTWLEGSTTWRHNYLEDVSTGAIAFVNLYDPGAPALMAPKFIQDSSWRQWQPYVEYELDIDGFSILPGVKYMHFTRYVDALVNQGEKVGADYSQTYTDTLPFFAVNKRLNDENSVYVQVSKGMHVPELGDLEQPASNGSTPPPETTTTYQAGVVHKSHDFTWDADAYYVSFNNIIEPTLAENGEGTYYDAGGAIYKGLEAQGTYVIGGGVAAYVALSKNDASYKAGNLDGNLGDVLAVPNGTISAGLLYNQGGWESSMIYKLTGAQFFGNDAEGYPNFRVGSYNTTEINVAYNWKISHFMLQKLRVQASVYNVMSNRSITGIFPGGSSPNPEADGYQFLTPASYMLTVKAEF